MRQLLLGTAGALVLVAAWGFMVERSPAYWAPLGQRHTGAVVLAALVVLLVAAAVFAVLHLHASGVEAGHLDAAIAGELVGPPAPASVRWRHSRGRRGGVAAIWVAVNIVLVWALWVEAHPLDLLLYAIAVVGFLGPRAYEWPWPIASSYPDLATIDDQGVHIHPLHISVPWHRVTRVELVSGWAGTGVVWRLDDPAAVAAATPVSPAQQRRLTRWMTANGGGIRLNASQMGEAPEIVYVVSARYRNHRTAVFAGLSSLDGS